MILLAAFSFFLCSTASAFQGGGGESTKKAKRKVTRIIEGAISGYECGDNCYLTITDQKGKEHTGLCTVHPLCTRWNAEVRMPDSYKGRRVRIAISKGTLLTGGGDVAGTMDAFTRIQFTDSESIRAQESSTDACAFCGVWEYVDNSLSGLGMKKYLKISKAGADKVKLITGEYQDGGINWGQPYIRSANGIYLRMVNGKLIGRFVSSNFWPTHGQAFSYKITCELKSNNKLAYSVWSSIPGQTDKQVATKISN